MQPDLMEILYGVGKEAGAAPAAPAAPQAEVVPPIAAPAAVPVAPAATAPAPIAPEAPNTPGFMDKLRSDPAMMQSVLMMGARLANGPRRGQDELGVLGDAMTVGSITHSMIRENERQAGVQGQELAMKQGESKARIAQSQAHTAGTLANTEQTQLQTAQSRISFPETQKKLALEMKRLTLENRRSDALALKAEFDANPERMAQAWGLDVQNVQAGIKQKNASAAASGASAANSAASAGLYNERTKAAQTLNASGQSAAVLHGTGKTGSGAAKDKMAEMEAYLLAGNPEADPKEIKQKVARMFDPSRMKGEDIATLRLLAEQGDDAQRVWALDRLAAGAGYGKEGAPTEAKPTTVKPVASGWFGTKKAVPLPPKDQLVKDKNYEGYGVWTGTGFRR